MVSGRARFPTKALQHLSLCFGFIPSGEEEGKEHRILEVGFERDDDELSVEKKSFSSVNSITYYNVEMLLFYCGRKARSRCLAAHRRLRRFYLCLALESQKRMDLMFCCCSVLFVCLFCFFPIATLEGIIQRYCIRACFVKLKTKDFPMD